MPPECPLIKPIEDSLFTLQTEVTRLANACDNHLPSLIKDVTNKVHKLELALVFIAGLASGLGILEGIQFLR